MGTNRFRLGVENIGCKTVWAGTVKMSETKKANDNVAPLALAA